MSTSNNQDVLTQINNNIQSKYLLNNDVDTSPDVFLAIKLSDYLEKGQPPPVPPHATNIDSTQSIPQLQDNKATTTATNNDSDALSLLWLPAHKHPEIAPSEFAKWIENNGSANIARKTSLRRKSSVLSQTHSISDENNNHGHDNKEDIVPPLPTPSKSSPLIDEGNSLEFDRNSPTQDTSRVLAPRGNRSLLRRSAFSARGRGSKKLGSNSSISRHGIHEKHQLLESVPENNQNITNGSPSPPSSPMKHNNIRHMEPVKLYDQPVSISEWIDLGSASLDSDFSQQGILSRVQDAESQIISQLMEDNNNNNNTNNNDDSMTFNNQSHSIPSTLPTSFNNNNNNKSEQLLPSINEPKDISPHISDNHSGSIKSPTTTTTTTTTTTSSPPPPSPSSTAATLSPPSKLNHKKSKEKIQRASSERLHVKEKKSQSWFNNIFNSNSNNNNNHAGEKEKKKNSRKVEDERYAQQQQHESKQYDHLPPNVTKKSGLGSLFSRSKSEHKSKTQKGQPHVISTGKDKKHHLLQQQQQELNGGNGLLLQYNSHRLPINVERSIYRMSHFKLADTRRPLHHQVVISNFMFWYLSIINQQQQKQHQQTDGQINSTHTPSSNQNTSNNNPTILKKSSQQQPSSLSSSSTTTTATTNASTLNPKLHAHFDETAKGPKTGRIGIPKQRQPTPTNHNPVSLSNSVTSHNNNNNNNNYNNHNNNQKDKNHIDDEEDDVPLSYYKQG